MIGGQHDVDAFAQQRLAVQVGVHGARLAVVLVADHHVQLVQPQCRRGLLDLELGGLDPDVGLARGQRSHRRRHDAEERGLEGGDPDHARRPAGGDRGQFRLGRLDPLEQRRGVPHQDLSRRSQPHIAPDPFQQRRPRLPLEHGELLRDGAGRVPKGPGGAVHGATAVYLAQQPQPVQIQHLFNIATQCCAQTRDGRERSVVPTIDPWDPLLCLLSAAGFGAMAVFGKLAYDAGVSVGRRCCWSASAWPAALLLALALARGALRNLSRRAVLVGLAMGACGYAAQAGLYFSALSSGLTPRWSR